MTPNSPLWSARALAERFSLEPSFVEALIADVPPAANRNGAKLWRMADVADALTSRRRDAEAIEMPELAARDFPRWMEWLAQAPPQDAAMTLALIHMAQRVPGLATAMAVGAGAPMKVAYALHCALKVAVLHEVVNLCIDLEIEPLAEKPEALRVRPSGYWEPDWERLAELAGEDVDFDRWVSYREERFGPNSEPGDVDGD